MGCGTSSTAAVTAPAADKPEEKPAEKKEKEKEKPAGDPAPAAAAAAQTTLEPSSQQQQPLTASALALQQPLPEPLQPSEETYAKAKSDAATNQVGGHGGKKSLKFKEGKVYKPVDTRTHELEFYEKVASGAAPMLVERSLAPRYYGRETLEDPEFGPVEYLVLEDVCAGFTSPSILDLKMGNQTWDQDCSVEKREGHIRRDAETTTGLMGFRFCGMKVWDVARGAYRKYPKHFGWEATKEEQMVQCLATFLHDGTRFRADLIPAFLERIAQIEEFLEQGTWRFYAASVLFVFDVEGGHAPEVRMIDFAHAWPISEEEGVRDTGFLMGLDYVRGFWRKIQARAKVAAAAAIPAKL